ncbi:MAG: hypothetical protein IPN76_14195 [Saprospiraceae bacterium]|nr:hypothetical protein [Saprospiraceae bacterium]
MVCYVASLKGHSTLSGLRQDVAFLGQGVYRIDGMVAEEYGYPSIKF